MSKFSKGNIRAGKLTPEKVLEMRQKYADGWTQGRLAREFQVSVGTVGKVVRGESWQQFQRPKSEAEVEVDAFESEKRFNEILGLEGFEPKVDEAPKEPDLLKKPNPYF